MFSREICPMITPNFFKCVSILLGGGIKTRITTSIKGNTSKQQMQCTKEIESRTILFIIKLTITAN